MVSYLFYSGINHAYAQTATAYPTFGPTCVATVGPGTPSPNPTFGPTCGVTIVPTVTRIPTPTRVPPTPTQPVSGNLGITLVILGIAAFAVIFGLTTLLSDLKSP